MFQERLLCSVCLVEAYTIRDHQVGCGGSCNRIFRHNSLQDVGLFSSSDSCLMELKRSFLAPRADLLTPTSHARKGVASCFAYHYHFKYATANSLWGSRNQGHALMVVEERTNS